MPVRRIAAALVLVALAAPAVVQAQAGPPLASTDVVADALAVDDAVVGQWVLVEVEEAGALGRFGARLVEMECVFGRDGAAEVALAVVQDGERYARTRAFRFTTAGTTIVDDRGDEMGTYEPLGTDELRLTMPDGLVARLRLAGR